MAASGHTGRGLIRAILAPFRTAAGMVQNVTGPWTRTNGISWLKLLVFILVLRWGFIELYSIPSGSMEPTLHGDPRFLSGDRVAVNKFLFGPRVPFTTWRLFPLGKPRRWDIVVFNSVEEETPHKFLIKRVVGLPGERIQIRDGKIFVNGEPATPPEGLEEILRYTRASFPTQEMVRVTLIGLAQSQALPSVLNLGKSAVEQLGHDIVRIGERVQGVNLEKIDEAQALELTHDAHPNSLEVVREWLAFKLRNEARYGVREEDRFAVVPEGHYLMLGDNSPGSHDGRYFGWVPHRNLYGRAFAVALPPSRMSDLTGFSATWSGRLLLCGIPAALILLEITRNFLVFTWRIRHTGAGTTLQAGDRVLVNRIALGVRLPFGDRRTLGYRPARPGEIVAYLDRDRDELESDLNFGRVLGSDTGEAAETTLRVVLENEDESSGEVLETGGGVIEIAEQQVIGCVAAVWWPPGRAQRMVLESPSSRHGAAQTK